MAGEVVDYQGAHMRGSCNKSWNVKKKVYVKSYGCQMNVYDAERMADVLAPEGIDEERSRIPL